MTLPGSGQLSASAINTELGRSSSARFDINGSSERGLAGVASGQISFYNFYGKSSVVSSSALYSTAGTYTWYVPAGVTSVSVVVIGAGGNGEFCRCGYPCSGGGGGSGGGLAYGNNISVSPGTAITIKVGNNSCGSSYFSSSGFLYAEGGRTPQAPYRYAGLAGGIGGGIGATAYYRGGIGGRSCCFYGGAGGGGAAGYNGDGGRGGTGGSIYGNVGGCGSGGGGGGGRITGCGVNPSGYTNRNGGGGGGVGVYGIGTNGYGGYSCSQGGGGGSGGSAGVQGSSTAYSGGGGGYGGGGGGAKPQRCGGFIGSNGYGNSGAVRIIWPGNSRSFPSTNAAGP